VNSACVSIPCSLHVHRSDMESKYNRRVGVEAGLYHVAQGRLVVAMHGQLTLM
jgi:hypothetical protein